MMGLDVKKSLVVLKRPEGDTFLWPREKLQLKKEKKMRKVKLIKEISYKQHGNW